MSFELSPQQRSAARAALIKAGVSTRGLTDTELQQAQERATPAPQPKAPTPQPQKEAAPMATPQATPTNPDALGAQIAALISASMKPAAPQIDEARLVELIKTHATTKLEITPRDGSRPVIVEGAHNQLADVVLWLSTGTNVFLCGPAGSGKTTIAEQAAEALKLPFYSSGAIMASYELLGVRNAHGDYIPTPLRQAFQHGGIFLLDEIDGCSPRALIAFNQLLANSSFTFPDGMIQKHRDFVVIAGANTTGQGATRQYVGRAELDKATLDRFIQIDVQYDADLEARLAHAEYEAHGGKDSAAIAKWLILVVKTRAKLQDMKSTALVTPRASIYGARGLANGLTIKQLTAQILHKHLSDDQRAQVRNV